MKILEVKEIVIHCSATRPGADIGVAEIRAWHTDPKPKGRGWSDIGYHFVIRRDGTLEYGRPLTRQGVHTRGHNRDSWGVCLVGGVDDNLKAEDNFTDAQYATLRTLLMALHAVVPEAEIDGHRDNSPDLNNDGVIDQWEWTKDCPCFDVRHWVSQRVPELLAA